MSTAQYVEHIADVYLLPLGLRLLIAVLIFFIGRALARGLLRAFDRVMESSQLDVSLRKFLRDILYAIMLVAIVIAALDAVGVETTAVIAVLGAAGLAIGLALQGSLSNFAAGVMLIVLRPYKVGDLVVIGKYLGRIEVIKVFHTVLITEDNREITIPNGKVIAHEIENLTALGRRRVDLIVSILDVTDLARVKQLLESTVLADKRILAAPPPQIEVAEVTHTGVKLHLRPWTAGDTYEEVAAATMERVRDTLAASNMKFTVVLQSFAPPK